MHNFAPQPWDSGLIGPDRRLTKPKRVHVYADREAHEAGLPEFVSRMVAEWADIDGRLAVVKPNITADMPTTRQDRRFLECEALAWNVISKMGFRNFNEVYLVEWSGNHGLKILSPVVSGLDNAETLDVEDRRALLLRNPEASAEFMAYKIITGDFDDKPRNYIVAANGRELTRIDYGFAFHHVFPMKEKGDPAEFRLEQLMGGNDGHGFGGSVEFAELVAIPAFRKKFADIANKADSVPKATWQSMVAGLEWVAAGDQKEIVTQLQQSGSRMRALLGHTLAPAAQPLKPSGRRGPAHAPLPAGPGASTLA